MSKTNESGKLNPRRIKSILTVIKGVKIVVYGKKCPMCGQDTIKGYRPMTMADWRAF
jgi:hypothetical protein